MIKKYLFAVMLAILSLSSIALEIDLTKANNNQVTLKSTTGKIKIDDLGVWNIWPNYTQIGLDKLNYDGKTMNIDFTFSPADTSIAWLDGRLLSLVDSKNNQEVLRLDMVRRGRFRLSMGEQKVLSRHQNWSSTVINWDNLTPKKISLRLLNNQAGLVIDGETIIALDNVKLQNGDYKIFLGSELTPDNRGALGWYSNLSYNESLDSVLPKKQPLPGKAEWAERVQTMEEFFVNPDMDKTTANVNNIRYYDARIAAAYIALDGLWYRLENNLEPGFPYFLEKLEEVAQEIKDNQVADYEIVIDNSDNKKDYFLSPNDLDYYYGDCGWGLASYAPEFAKIGLNLVSEHIWPGAIFDDNGNYQDVMLIRRTMPQLEEYEKYNINLDVMIAPYTPSYLLKQRPEWEGLFFGLGAENEEEKLKEHAKNWKGRQAGHGFLKASVIDPEYISMCEKFISYLLPKIANSKAVIAFDLANEVQFEDYSPLMQQYFRDYLKKKYGSIEKLNSAWGEKYSTFEDILMVQPIVFQRSNPTRFYDWVLCNRQAGTKHFQFLQDLCKKYAPKIPTHIKYLPHEFGTPWMVPESSSRNFYDYADGIDRKELSQLTEIIGTDSWADNAHDASGRLSSDVPYQSMYFSLLKSYSPDKWIFDSEWHILRCDPPATPRPCLEMVMQQNAVNGLKAGTFWLVCPGNGQQLEHSSTATLMLTAGLTTAKIRSQQKYFNAINKRPKRVGFLYSPHARYVGTDRHVTTLLKYFEASMFSGVEVRMVEERQLINKEVTAKDLDLLIAIECNYPLPEVIDALNDLSKGNTKLIKIGNFGNLTYEANASKNLAQVNFDKSEKTQINQNRIVKQLQALVEEFKLSPQVVLRGLDNQNIYGIEYHLGKLDDGRKVIYIANMSKNSQTLKLFNSKKLIDVTNNKVVDNQTITMNNYDTFIGIYE